LGYLEDLERKYADPIKHSEAVVAKMNEEAALENQLVTTSFDPKETLTESNTNRKNIGNAALSKLCHMLNLDTFFYNNSRPFKSEFNTKDVMKSLIFSRILEPASKKKTYEK
jgi:hypothetical protein